MKLQYTGTFNGEIKLCDYAEAGQPTREIMLNTAVSRELEVSDGAAALIQSLYPNVFVEVVATPAAEVTPAEAPKRNR